MSYYLRDVNGVMKAELSNFAAGQCINELDGKWVEKNFKSEKKIVFQFTSYYILKSDYSGVTLFLWEGDYLVAKD